MTTIEPSAPENLFGGVAARRPGRWRLVALLGAGLACAAVVLAAVLFASETPADRPTANAEVSRDAGEASPATPPAAMPTVRATPETLAALPAEFPTAIARSARFGDRSVVAGNTVVTLALDSSTSAPEDLFAIRTRLRDAGWQVDPPSQADGFGFTGFGWRGTAAASPDGGALVLEVRRTG